MRNFLTGSVNFDRVEQICSQNTHGSKQHCVRYTAFQLQLTWFILGYIRPEWYNTKK